MLNGLEEVQSQFPALSSWTKLTRHCKGLVSFQGRPASLRASILSIA